VSLRVSRITLFFNGLGRLIVAKAFFVFFGVVAEYFTPYHPKVGNVVGKTVS